MPNGSQRQSPRPRLPATSRPRALSFTRLGLLLVGATPGCTYDCPAPHDYTKPSILEVGTTNPARTVYESAPFDGAFQHAPPGEVLAFRHHLLGRPVIVQTWLAFDERPLGGHGTGNIVLAAGNEAMFNCVDAEFIELRNDSCEKSFYVRVAASEPVTPEEQMESSTPCSASFGGATSVAAPGGNPGSGGNSASAGDSGAGPDAGGAGGAG